VFKRDDLPAIAVVAAGALLVGLTVASRLTRGASSQHKAAAASSAVAQSVEVSIESFSHRGEFVRHKGGKGFVSAIMTPLDARDARFKKVAGLADAKGVSFESTHDPGHYLRHRSGRLILTPCPGALDKADATFLVKKGLADDQDEWISLGLFNFPGHFLQVRNGELWTGSQLDRADFPKSATFRFDKPVSPRDRRVLGWTAADIRRFDAVMLKYGTKIGCTAAELAIARNGVVILARGYGSSDRFGRVPMHPNNPMAIGSCEKPITAAVIRQLARAGKLNLSDTIFKVLKIRPAGPIVDNRIWDITIQHVLGHKSGWQCE
jgi:alpha-L-arabinofuranosidase B-like protein/beta-lactamase family protein